MTSESQPTSKCPCGHHLAFHTWSHGECRRCQCPRYAGPPPKRPDWYGVLYSIDGTIVEDLRGRPRGATAKPESYYRDLLARQVGGRTEVILPFGRADVMTDTMVWEVEPAARWTYGIAQALQYAAQVPQRGAIALYGDGVPLAKVHAKLASLPAPGLELWWLAGDLFVRVKEVKART